MDTCPFLGPLIPLFWISGDIFSWFESQSGFCLICFFAEANVMHIPRDLSLVLHMPTSWWPVHSWSLPNMHVQRWDLLGFKQAITQTEYKCTTTVPAINLEWRNTIFYPYISSGLTLSVFTPITHMYSTVSYFCNIICSILKCIQHSYLVRTR